VPKLVEVVNDFSGGIAKGYNPENLKNNQMQVCENLIADGVGSLTTVPNVETRSTSDINASIPPFKTRNLHTWSTDTNLSLPQQPSNTVDEPTLTEVVTAKRARLLMYMSPFSPMNTGLRFTAYDVQREEVIFNWGIELIKNITDWKHIIGESVLRLESRIHQDDISNPPQYKSDVINYRWATHAEMSSYLDGDGTEMSIGSLDPESNIVDPHYAEYNAQSHIDGDANYNNGDYKITALNGNGEFYNHSRQFSYVLRTMAIFDYYGSININFLDAGGSLNKVKPASGNLTVNSESMTWDNLNYSITDTTPKFGNSSVDSGSGTTHMGLDNFMWSKVASGENTGWQRAFGAYVRWKYIMASVPSNETATYSISINFYTNPEQSSTTEVAVTHDAQVGETSQDIIDNLFSKLITKIGDTCPDQQIYYEWREDGTGIDFGQNFDTPKPYGFQTSTATKTNIETQSDIQAGQQFSNMLVISSSESTAKVYNLNEDNFLDYSIDLKINSASYDTQLSYADTQGYLKVCDSIFYSNNKPKWYGYLNFNAYTYIDHTFVDGDGNTSTGGFFIDDVAPTPWYYNKLQDGGDTSNIKEQPSHQGHTASVPRLFLYQDDQDTFDVTFSVTGTNRVHDTGLKLRIDWIDGVDSDADKLDGAFRKDEKVEFYWSYVYVGGGISQPIKFTKGSSATGGVPWLTSPKADDVAMGFSIAMGPQMINGDDTDTLNKRLKGIEIWAKYHKYDANNLYQICEIDLIKGWFSSAIGEWKPFETHVGSDNELKAYITTKTQTDVELGQVPIFTTYPLISFYSKYRCSYDSPIGFESGGTGWKSHVVFNRRSYYGNVRIKNANGIITYYPDGIIKSAKGMYDVVSADNLIEATINDGDEITCLEVAGNKLMQFKKNSLAIMGIKTLENGENRETIEQTIQYCGVSSENQVCKTPYGVFWISRSGIYVYDGEKLDKLTENLQGSTISKVEWENFFGDRTHIGYDAYWNQIHICQDTQNNPKTLIYSFNTRAFTESNKLYASDIKTGFVNDINGHLLWAQVGTGSSSVTTNEDNNPNNFNKAKRRVAGDEQNQGGGGAG